MPKRSSGAMHVAKIITRRGDASYAYHLLRQSYREGSKVKHRTLANLSALPLPVIDAIRRGLAGEELISAHQALAIIQSRAHGHVAAVLGAARKLGLETLLDPHPGRHRDLAMAMIVGRVLEPASKLATTRLFATTSLGSTLGVEDATEDEMYAAMDWLLTRQERIEKHLAGRYLSPGGVVLYDLTSTYVEGSHCPLAKRGYSRDGKPGKQQIEFGLLTNGEGVPVAIEAFAGNTGDPATFQGQERKVRERFGVSEVVWVADRGMLTGTQVEKLQQVVGAHWITALRAPTIQQLVEAGSIQLSLFDQQNLAEVTDSRYPGERLVVCYNPMLAEKRSRQREDMLKATEKEISRVALSRAMRQGAAAMGERVGRVINKYQMAKHFTWQITDGGLSHARKENSIAEEAALDGLYVLRTNVSQERMDTAEVVLAYKSLAHVERAFRHFKLSDLEVRPIYHYTEPRVRAHLFLCMLAYWVQREMQRALAPLLFVDEAPPDRPDPVAPAPRSAGAVRKDRTQRTVQGQAVHSFKTLLASLATLVKNKAIPRGAGPEAAFDLLTQPTPFQQQAFQLLGLRVPGM